MDRRGQRNVLDYNAWGVLHLPAPALIFQLRSRERCMARPLRSVGIPLGQLQGKALVDPGKIALEVPGLLGDVGAGTLLVFVSDDGARIRGGRVG